MSERVESVVYVVDDDAAVRESMTFLLGSHGIKQQALESAEKFLETATSDSRGCILLDVRMPGMSGLQLHRSLGDHGITMPVIILTGHSDVPMAVTAMKNGAFDLLEKPCDHEILLERIKAALTFDRSRVVDATFEQTAKQHCDTLTPREREVFELVVAGYLNKQIASMLGVSIKTIEVHRSRVMEKMKAASLPDLVRMATALGLD